MDLLFISYCSKYRVSPVRHLLKTFLELCWQPLEETVWSYAMTCDQGMPCFSVPSSCRLPVPCELCQTACPTDWPMFLVCRSWLQLPKAAEEASQAHELQKLAALYPSDGCSDEQSS